MAMAYGSGRAWYTGNSLPLLLYLPADTPEAADSGEG